MRRSIQYIALVLVIVGIAAWSVYNHHRMRMSGSAPLTYQVGLVTWIGYSPIYIAEDKGFFSDEGLNVDVTNMDQPGARESAFFAGKVDFFPNTPDAFVITTSEQPLPGRIISAFDRSYGADGLIAKNSISMIEDLKGKTVGFQKGITSHFLLLYFLHQHGLTGADIKQVSLSADDAGASFLAGQLDAAATWEPWLTKAREAAGSHVLATSAQMDDRIVDVLMVSKRVLDHPEIARKFMHAWYRGLAFMQEHPEEANIMLGRHLGAPPSDVEKMKATVQFMNERESQKYVQDKLPVIGAEISDLYLAEGLIRQKASLSAQIDATLLEAKAH